MEVLSINMIHEIWLLMELLHVEIFNSKSIFSGFFDMESVCNESNVWVQESHDVRHGLLSLGSWVEDKLDPSSSSSGSDVVFNWSADFSLSHESSADHSV